VEKRKERPLRKGSGNVPETFPERRSAITKRVTQPIVMQADLPSLSGCMNVPGTFPECSRGTFPEQRRNVTGTEPPAGPGKAGGNRDSWAPWVSVRGSGNVSRTSTRDARSPTLDGICRRRRRPQDRATAPIRRFPQGFQGLAPGSRRRRRPRLLFTAGARVRGFRFTRARATKENYKV